MPRFSSLHLNCKCHQRTFWRLIYIFFFIEFDPSSDGIQSSRSSSQWAPCQQQHRDCLENTWLSAVAAHIDSVSFSGQSSSLFFFCVLRAVVIEPVGTRSSPVQRLRHELHTNPYITQFEWFSLFVPIDDRCLPSMSFDCIGSSFSFLSISLESIKGRHLIKIVAPFPKQHIKQTKEARTESLKNRNETELIDHPNVLKKNYNSVLPICKRWGNPTTNTRRIVIKTPFFPSSK